MKREVLNVISYRNSMCEFKVAQVRASKELTHRGARRVLKLKGADCWMIEDVHAYGQTSVNNFSK